MRLFKYIVVVFTLLIMVLATAFYSRSSVVISIVNDYLSQHESAITCIDFNVNSNFDLQITHLCIDSPYAEIDLTNILIKWRFEVNNLSAEKIIEAISSIDIASANVRVKANIKLDDNHNENTVTLSDLPTLIRNEFQTLTQLWPAFDIAIQSFNYQPFLAGNDKNPQRNKYYQGQFTTTAWQIYFSLANQNQQEILSLQLNKIDQGLSDNISAKVSADLAQMSILLSQHQAFLPVSISSLLTNEVADICALSGDFVSDITWQKQTLSMVSKVRKLAFMVPQSIAQFGLVKLETTLVWHTQLKDEILSVDFDFDDAEDRGNALQLTFEQGQLIDSLSAKNHDQRLINFLNDNVINDISVIPAGSIIIDFTEQSLTSDGISFHANHLNEPIGLSLNNLVFSFDDQPTFALSLQQGHFLMVGKVNIAQLQPYSQYPVKLNIAGQLEQQSDLWQLNLAPETSITVVQLSVPASHSQQGKSNSKSKSKTKAQTRLKSLISHWHGYVKMAKKSLPSTAINHAEITFELAVNNQVSQLSISELIQINTLELDAKLSGSIDNIVINTEVIADKVAIASVRLTGDIAEPHIEVFANEVLLTEVLALKIELPVELKLIDGTLSYHLSGQFKNTEDLTANPMSLVLLVQDVSGEIEGTWVQGLNWQQKFSLQAGQFKSVTTKSGNKITNNLTIDKIESATPITQFSTKTRINISEDVLKLNLNNISGNLLGGRFDIAQAQWPFTKVLAVQVNLTEIDLEKLLELDKNQGIVVTGKVSGQFPIYYDGEDFLIKAGSLYNVGNGIIQVYNNPAVAELKTSSTELKLVFSALENLHYHHLTSAVSMADDGYMLLVTEIKGRNPDLDNEVNLNLNLNYDLLGLLESLNITEHFENKVLKGLQKKN
ncbi:intermembrane phospholipid transport protein YdbH family protein [Colwellia piezophila]|uniref:intermembrane phospholipid transport protein YdbH family protein n=1 Tax=Colwellia piezophila TaxID=211668 RepID=UPI00037CF536|nr:YdbH domain-containing protein [Colwellia piezophila]